VPLSNSARLDPTETKPGRSQAEQKGMIQMTRNETIRFFAHKWYGLAGKLFPATIAGLIFNRIWLAMLLVCSGMTVAAYAQPYYTVDCSGALPGSYPTINSALQVAGPGSYVIIASPCSENVAINNASNLNVGAYSGSTVNINGSISITGSNSVFLYGLNVTNALGDAYTITSSHNVTLWTWHFEWTRAVWVGGVPPWTVW
jgi:hypothetical protein